METQERCDNTSNPSEMLPMPAPPPPPPAATIVTPPQVDDSKDSTELIRSFERTHLRPTTTVVYQSPVVAGRNNITAAPTEEEVKEYFDSEEDLQNKAVRFAQLIKEARHLVVYTGAGISTAAKIPDYRGPQGVWTLQAKGKAANMPITLEQAIPTFSHMALVELMKRGILKFVVSTNVDGLHRRSGIPEESMAELHGNVYREVCSNEECKKEYLRNFNVTKTCKQRYTGRLCNACGDRLRDSIINFGENLPERALSLASHHSSLADVTLVLGSSMRVQPACNLPAKSYSKGGVFSICNLQKTHFDKYTDTSKGLRIFARCDDFLMRVMAELDIPVPEFQSEGDEEIAKQMQEMIFDESFDALPAYNRVSMSMADDPIPSAVLDEILRGMFNLRGVSVERSPRATGNGK